LRSVYYAHVFSHIKSNVVFWGFSAHANRIFVLQKRAVRIMYNVRATHSCMLHRVV
jgi:hypothetical protein